MSFKYIVMRIACQVSTDFCVQTKSLMITFFLIIRDLSSNAIKVLPERLSFNMAKLTTM